MIDKALLAKYTNAFILYEIANHGVDPREQLSGTTMRIIKDEGFKYLEIEDWEKAVHEEGPFSEKTINAINHTILVDFLKKSKLIEKMTGSNSTSMENALTLLYKGDDDEKAFHDLADLVGRQFDVLGYLFFLKDPHRYLPIRSQLFDDRFALLGVESGLAGNCNWGKYLQYNGWIKEAEVYLQETLNPDITMIDAHSFIWVLPGLKSYLENGYQAVEHSKFGKGIVLGFEDDKIVVMFGKEKKWFNRDAAFKKGLLRMIPSGVDIDSRELELQLVDDESKQLNADEDSKLIQDLITLDLPATQKKPAYRGGKEAAPEGKMEKGHLVPSRSRQIAWNALVLANYQCEIDPNHETFIRRNSDKPYTEPHHLVPLAYQDQLGVNLDREENIVSLCSNCHNRIHYGKDAEVLVEKLYRERCDLLISIGVELPLEELLRLYE